MIATVMKCLEMESSHFLVTNDIFSLAHCKSFADRPSWAVADSFAHASNDLPDNPVRISFEKVGSGDRGVTGGWAF